MSDVSVIGLGAMGSALAAALLQRGMAVTVWNRSANKADPLIAKGASRAANVADAVSTSKLVIVCLLNYDTVHEALGSAGDALKGRALVNLTNGTPAQAREMAKWAKGLGALYLDGGIMAIPPMIGQPGALILYSGSRTVFEAHGTALNHLGERQIPRRRRGPGCAL